jgi:hypothetical protein
LSKQLGKTTCQNRLSKQLTKADYQNGLAKWLIKTAYQSRLSKWLGKTTCQNRLSKWLIKTAWQNGLSKRLGKADYQNGLAKKLTKVTSQSNQHRLSKTIRLTWVQYIHQFLSLRLTTPYREQTQRLLLPDRPIEKERKGTSQQTKAVSHLPSAFLSILHLAQIKSLTFRAFDNIQKLDRERKK